MPPLTPPPTQAIHPRTASIKQSRTFQAPISPSRTLTASRATPAKIPAPASNTPNGHHFAAKPRKTSPAPSHRSFRQQRHPRTIQHFFQRAPGATKSSSPRNTPNSIATAAASSACASPVVRRHNPQLPIRVHHSARPIHNHRSRRQLRHVPQHSRLQRALHRIKMIFLPTLSGPAFQKRRRERKRPDAIDPLPPCLRSAVVRGVVRPKAGVRGEVGRGKIGRRGIRRSDIDGDGVPGVRPLRAPRPPAKIPSPQIPRAAANAA